MASEVCSFPLRPQKNLPLTLQFSQASLVPGMSNNVACPARGRSKQHRLQGKELFVCIPGQGGVGRPFQTTLITSPDFSNRPCQAQRVTLTNLCISKSGCCQICLLWFPSTSAVQLLTVLSGDRQGLWDQQSSARRLSPGTQVPEPSTRQVSPGHFPIYPLSIQYLGRRLGFLAGLSFLFGPLTNFPALSPTSWLLRPIPVGYCLHGRSSLQNDPW